MPALSAAVGVRRAARDRHGHHRHRLARRDGDSAALMLPAMNVEDRVELVGGMREGMPPEVFAGVWGLIEGVLAVDDFRQLAARLGIA